MSADGARYSIVRRSFLVVAFLIVGHGFNYLLLLVANRTVDATAFGRFYAAWATLNILVTPAVVLALLVTRYYTDAFQSEGGAGVFAAMTRAARMFAPGVVIAVLALELIFYFAGMAVADSVVLMALLPITAASVFAVELVRAALPSMLRSTLFGAAWLVWCMAQCLLGLAGLALFKTVWAAYAGVLIANLVTLAALVWLVRRVCNSLHMQARPAAPPSRLSLREALPFCSAYAGFVLLNNVDILIAYFALNSAQLGVYSAAAILPKAIVTVTQPIAQIVLPVLIAVKGQATLMRHAIARALGATATMGIAACVILWASSSTVCGGGIGIRFCQPKLMIVLAAAAACLAIVRVAITADLGQQYYWLAHLPLLGCLLFAAAELTMRPSPETLASSYTLASILILFTFAVLSWMRRHFKGLAAAHETLT